MVGRLILKLLESRTTTRIHHSKWTQDQFCDRDGVVIPLGNYGDWYRGSLRGPTPVNRSAEAILFFGMVRPYKGIEQLLDAFQGLPEPGSLTVVGAPIDNEYGRQIAQRAKVVPRCTAFLEFVDDGTLWRFIKESALVVLPFRSITNSGSLLTALAGGSPVLVPNSRLAVESLDEFGGEWVRVYQPPLTSDELRDALAWAGTPRPERPAAMHLRSWEDAANAHLKVYQSAAGAQRRAKHHSPEWRSAHRTSGA
ncbi:MAG: glycosyltransferase [Bifidobacteriaceae bacterium]|nr:glycosyltransferase [Bifidobacteriaceae bacterium]